MPFYHPRSEAVLFSVMSVCKFVCLPVITITPEPLGLEILSRKFQGSIERVDRFENGYAQVVI